MTRIIAALLPLLALACSATEPPPSAAPESLVENAEPGGEEIELDRRADGARLVGLLRAAPAGTDADRVLEAEVRMQAEVWAIGPVLDARFVDGAIVLVDEAHRLVTLRDGERVELDRLAEAPLAVREGVVVYARGEMPFFELARLDVASGAIAALTDGHAPAYSPSIDADGSIVFVSCREGRPRLHRVSPDGQIRALPWTRRTPSSPRAPRLERGVLTFDDERGTTSLEVATGREVTP